MTKSDLQDLIARGENSSVEFTTDEIDDRALAKDIVAFANLRGGRILLGIDDYGSLLGLARRDPPTSTGRVHDEVGRRTYRGLEEWVFRACRDKIRPEIIPHFEIVREVMPGQDVAVVLIDRGWTVHSVWHGQHHTYYVRVGSINREAS